MIEGANCGLLDVVGGGEVGLPRAEVDDVDSLAAETLRIGLAKAGGGYSVSPIDMDTYVARVLAGEAVRDSQPAAGPPQHLARSWLRQSAARAPPGGSDQGSSWRADPSVRERGGRQSACLRR